LIAYRAFPYRLGARPSEAGGPLWIPKSNQGAGRHDNPARFGCLYASEAEVSVVAEYLQHLRGRPLRPEALEINGHPIAVGTFELADDATVVDLDDPVVLRRERLRPSHIATGNRERTQGDARALYDRHPDAAALRWWSTLEASWANLTIFGRARMRLRLRDVRQLTLGDPAVRDAADALGLGLP
jgi:hypothetical protein